VALWSCDRLPVSAGFAIAQSTLMQFGEHIATGAATEAPGEQPSAITIAQSEAAPAMQRATAPPRSALAPCVAERSGDGGGAHLVSRVERVLRVGAA
jgi:hypothetical protein